MLEIHDLASGTIGLLDSATETPLVDGESDAVTATDDIK